jgi:protein-tyrosine phosphatase
MELMDSVVQQTLSLENRFYSFCFICFGNICRSPALAAIFMSLAEKKGVADQFFVDSMGLTIYYLGKQADLRMCKAAEKKQIVIKHISKLFKPSDFQRFDQVFAVSDEAIDVLMDIALSEEDKKKIVLATAFSKKFKDQDIPDPYYDGPELFDLVVEMAFDACEGILHHFSTQSESDGFVIIS